MAELEYLTAADVLALTESFFQRLGYARPVLRANGEGLLESAVQRAQSAGYYGGAEPVVQAAAMTNAIAQNRPFVDGNKRSAWIACVTFLWLNNHPLPDAALEPLAEQLIAQHELADRSQADLRLADWLQAPLELAGAELP